VTIMLLRVNVPHKWKWLERFTIPIEQLSSRISLVLLGFIIGNRFHISYDICTNRLLRTPVSSFF